MHSFRPILIGTFIGIVLLSLVLSQFRQLSVLASSQPHIGAQFITPSASTTPPAPTDIQLDPRLPVQTYVANTKFANVNATFGSRFDFSIFPNFSFVGSGTEGVFHDNTASYIIGLSPTGEHKTFMFHMGSLNALQGDVYLANEHWIQGLDTTRWIADTPDGSGLRLVMDIINPFLGDQAGCTAIASCARQVKDDTMPALIVAVSLQNPGNTTLTGTFLFGNNRQLPAKNACVPHGTAGRANVNIFSYDTSSDVAGGILFLAGDQGHWGCNTSASDRAGLAWNYSIGPGQTNTAYLIVGGWNANQHIFVNPQQPANCRQEGFYAAEEWTSQDALVDFAIDNLSTRDNLLARAQLMENILLSNNVLTPTERWIIGNTLRSYKASTWLMGSRNCRGSYDAAVYEGTFGFLTTVDVMHEYSYFEINRVPWFFKSALTTVFKNVTRDSFGTYFQHDQGGDVDSNGNCTQPGRGIPTIRPTCYAPPLVWSGLPMSVEENDNVALLTAYYVYMTGDIPFASKYINLIDAGMAYNTQVADPATGIAYNFQGTTTTYDAASDCLHNNIPGAGNVYYQGLKEATSYRATAYLDGIVPGGMNAMTWKNAATKIENSMVQEYNRNGYIPIGSNDAFNNCNGRSVSLGEGLFYLHLIGLDNTMNQTLLQDLAQQYPDDLKASTLSSTPMPMIAVSSSTASGPQCGFNHCRRYEWFSKVMLSSIVADLIYTAHGCIACSHVNVMQTAYNYNLSFGLDFGDGLYDDGTDWGGHDYPRGIISWAFLMAAY